MKGQTPNYMKSQASMLFTIFSILIILFSAVTSFGFFYFFFGEMIPYSLVGEQISRLFSGFSGVILFDIAAVIWLNTFLHKAETAEQRGISLALTIFTFLGAATASVAYLSLSVNKLFVLEQSAQNNISLISLVIVIVAIVFNFGAIQVYSRYSLMSKSAVREADRRDFLQEQEEAHMQKLDTMITKKTGEYLEQHIDGLAAQNASKLVEEFVEREGIKGETGRSQVQTNRPIPPNGPRKISYSITEKPEGGFTGSMSEGSQMVDRLGSIQANESRGRKGPKV